MICMLSPLESKDGISGKLKNNDPSPMVGLSRCAKNQVLPASPGFALSGICPTTLLGDSYFLVLPLSKTYSACTGASILMDGTIRRLGFIRLPTGCA